MRKVIEDDELWFRDAPTKWLLDTTIGQFINTIESHDDWEDSEKSDFALKHLKGPAHQFAKWFLKDKKMEWMIMKEKLYQQFKSKLNIWEKVELRKNLIQLEDESIKDFFHRCVTCQYVICDDYSETVFERDIMINFLLGMRKDIFEELTKGQLPSEKMDLYSCFEEVIKLEMVMDYQIQIELEKMPMEKRNPSENILTKENIKIEPDILNSEEFKEEIKSVNGSEDYFEDNKPMGDNDNMVEPDKRIEQIVSTNGFEDSDSEAMLNNDEEIELDETISENIKLEHSSDIKSYEFDFKEECKSLFKFKCNFCDFDNSFICKRHLETHIKKEHPDVKKGKKFICKCCGKSYRDKTDLFRHMKNNHASEELSNKQSITQTKEVKEEPVSDNSADYNSDENNDNDSDFDYDKEIAKRKFKCTQCGDGFSKKRVLELHLKQMHDMVLEKNGNLLKSDTVIDNDNENTKSHKMIQCKLCEVKSGSHNIHYRHMLNFHPDETFFCKICPNRHKFANFATDLPKDQAMQIHNMIHHGQTDPENPNKVLCTLCTKKKLFVIKRRIKAHVITVHYKEHAKNQCTICGKLFYQPCKLKEHMEKAHLKSKIHECKDCGAKFETFGKYHYHMANFHSKEQFICEECGKNFPNKLRLTEHMTSHLDRTHVCEDCGLSFKTEKALQQHKLSHSEKSFKCTVPGCNKEFSGKAGVRSHIKNIHLKKENFTCDQCSKEFKQRTTLRNHINIHHLGLNDVGKNKMHRCQFCDYEAKYTTTLKSHINSVHKGIIYRCDFPGCTKEMNRKGNLDVHKYNSHGIPMPHHINPPKKIIIENI